MGELVVSVFTAEKDAVGVLNDLRACGVALESVASAGTVGVLPGGSYTVGTTDHPGATSGFSGAFWEALFGLLLLVHLPGSSYGPNAGRSSTPSAAPASTRASAPVPGRS